MCLMDEMSHRGNFWTWSLVHTISLITIVVFFKVVYSGGRVINGWDQYQSLLVLGTGTLIGGLGSLTFFSFMYDFGQRIKDGDMDFRLTKPMDVHFLSAFHWVDMEDFVTVPNSLLLIGYAVWNLRPQNLWVNLVGYLFALFLAMIILFSLLTLIQSLAFKYIKIDSVSNFYWSIVNISKYPAKAIKGLSLIGSTLLIPIAVISSLPAEILFGRWDWTWIVGSAISATFIFFLSRKVFMSSLRYYSSASS